MIKKIVSLACACLIPLAATTAHADLLFTGSATTNTDADILNSASAQFSINGSGQLVVTLTNTNANQFTDSQSVTGLSFVLQNFGGATLTATLVAADTTNPYGTIASMPALGTAVTINSSGLDKSWSQLTGADGGNLPDAAGTNAISANGPKGAGGGSSGWISAEDGIVGAVNGSGKYAAPVSGNCSGAGAYNCGSSATFGCNEGQSGGSCPAGASDNDGTEIYKAATFVFNITGGTLDPSLGSSLNSTCTSGHTCVSGLVFGMGPDGWDADDILTATAVTNVTPPGPTPEPSSLLLLGTGILGAAGIFRRRMQSGAAIR